MDKNIIYLSANGYKISSLYGKILFDGRSWNTLNEAEDFCKSEGLDYSIA